MVYSVLRIDAAVNFFQKVLGDFVRFFQILEIHLARNVTSYVQGHAFYFYRFVVFN